MGNSKRKENKMVRANMGVIYKGKESYCVLWLALAFLSSLFNVSILVLRFLIQN